MAKPGSNGGSSDFNADELTKKTNDHTEALNELQKRVGTNENFASTFKAAAETQRPIHDAEETSVIALLENNEKAQAAVENIVKKIDGRETKKQLWGLGKIALWILSLIVTAFVTAWLTIIVTNANQKDTPTTG